VGGVGRHAAQAEEDERLEAADVLVAAPELCHVVVGGVGRELVDAVRDLLDGGAVEVDVRDRGEKAVDHDVRGLLRGALAARVDGETDQRAGEPVLQICDVGGFPADARAARAALAAGRLFTLEAKHFTHFNKAPFLFSLRL